MPGATQAAVRPPTTQLNNPFLIAMISLTAPLLALIIMALRNNPHREKTASKKLLQSTICHCNFKSVTRPVRRLDAANISLQTLPSKLHFKMLIMSKTQWRFYHRFLVTFVTHFLSFPQIKRFPRNICDS